METLTADNPPPLSALLDDVDARAMRSRGARVSVGALLARTGRRAYGPLLVLIGLFSISPLTAAPGMTWLAAAVTLVVAAQMALGRERPWLPKAALRVTMPAGLVRSGVSLARPWASWADGVLRQRLAFLTEPPWVNIVALFVMAAALVTIPLGFVPLAPLIPGLTVVMFGLGMLARDGLVLALGAGALTSAGAFAAWLFL